MEDLFMELHSPSLDIFKPSERDVSIIDYENVQVMPGTGSPNGYVMLQHFNCHFMNFYGKI